jgi:hypothetical protein
MKIMDLRNSSKEPSLAYTTPFGLWFHTTHFLHIRQSASSPIQRQ